jgi:hypothetical protein
MAEMICNPHNCVGRNPTGHAHNQAAEVITGQLMIGSIGSFVGRVINNQAAVNHAAYLRLQSSQSLIVLHLQPLDGGIHLAEAHKTNSTIIHNNSPLYVTEAIIAFFLFVVNMQLSAPNGKRHRPS